MPKQSTALTTGFYMSFYKARYFAIFASSFTAFFSKFSLSANLAAGKKASCILKSSSSVVAVDLCPMSPYLMGGTCFKRCTLCTSRQYQLSAIQACSLVHNHHSATLSQPQSPTERLPQSRFQRCMWWRQTALSYSPQTHPDLHLEMEHFKCNIALSVQSTGLQ